MKRIAIAVLTSIVVFAAAVSAQTPPKAPDVVLDVAPFEHELMFLPEDDDESMAFAPDAPGGGDIIVRRMHHGRGPMRHRVRHLEMMAAELELSEEQRTKMRDIAEKQRRQSIRAKADLDIARLDLHGLMRVDQADLAKINAQIDKMAKMRADLQKSQVASRIEMRSVLTPEQQKKMKELRTTPRKMKMRRAAPAPGSPDGDI